MPRETTEQRRARIRAKLSDDQTPTHPILAPAKEPEIPADTPEPETPDTPDVPKPPSGSSRPIRRPSSRGIGQKVVERRQSRPTNYKVHVVTAMGLTLAVRVMALGIKAAFGGK